MEEIMTKIEKLLCESFFHISVPQSFLNTSEKVLINEYFKGECQKMLDNDYIDYESYEKMNDLKNYLSSDIDFSDYNNVIYFDLMRLFLAIVRKYID